MISALLVAIAIAGGASKVVPELPAVTKVSGPYFLIPCRLPRPQEVDRVQLYVSDNRGETWTMHSEIAPDQTEFAFRAKTLGEYWFTARIKNKDGTLNPADPAHFTPMQRVILDTVTESMGALVERMSPTPAPAPILEHYYLNSRKIRLPIRYEKDRKSIEQVQLWVARGSESAWVLEDTVPPERDSFIYVAKEDGVYWFTMVIEDLQGRRAPENLVNTPPDLKAVVDTQPPRVQFTNARRSGEEVIVQWFVQDNYPDEDQTRVHFHPVGSAEGFWQEVTLPANSKSGVRFPAGTARPVIVRVTAFDRAGNKTEIFGEIPGSGTTTAGSTKTYPTPNSTVVPAGGATVSASLIPLVNELDDELNRLELELIRKELKQLAEKNRLSPGVEERIDRLRVRLRDVRERLSHDRNGSSTDLQVMPAAVPFGQWIPVERFHGASNDSPSIPTLPPLPHPNTGVDGQFEQPHAFNPGSLFLGPRTDRASSTTVLLHEALPRIPAIPVPSLPVAPEPRLQEKR